MMIRHSRRTTDTDVSSVTEAKIVQDDVTGASAVILAAPNTATTLPIPTAATAPVTTSSTPLADQLCQQLTACVTSLQNQAQQVRIARTCRQHPVLRQRLAELDQILTATEARTQALVAVVNAEQAALHKVQAQHRVAQEQYQYLIAFQENLPSNIAARLSIAATEPSPPEERSNTLLSASTPPVQSSTNTTENNNRNQHTKLEVVKHEKIFHPENGRSVKKPPATKTERRQHQQPQQHIYNPLPPQQKRGLEDPITLDELELIPRTTRGRISLYVLNDALSDIAAHCRRRARASAKKKKQLQQQQSLSQHHHQYHQYPSALLLEEEHTLHVEEQELRQSCSFFRTGESTARSILLILRTLGRLQQIPAKHGEVTYIVDY